MHAVIGNKMTKGEKRASVPILLGLLATILCAMIMQFVQLCGSMMVRGFSIEVVVKVLLLYVGAIVLRNFDKVTLVIVIVGRFSKIAYILVLKVFYKVKSLVVRLVGAWLRELWAGVFPVLRFLGYGSSGIYDWVDSMVDCIWFFHDSESRYVGLRSGDGENSVSVRKGSDFLYGYCSVCKFNVRLLDHDKRCRKQSYGRLLSASRRLAWLGDALHRMDVVNALFAQGGTASSVVRDVNFYVHRGSQADYMRVRQAGFENFGSDRGAAELFEACYVRDSFRSSYVQYLFEVSQIESDASVCNRMEVLSREWSVTSNALSETYTSLVALGEVIFTLDVRSAIILSGVSDTELQPAFAKYANSDALSIYLSGRKLKGVPLRGTSGSAVARAFKANYFGDFRKEYLLKTFGLELEGNSLYGLALHKLSELKVPFVRMQDKSGPRDSQRFFDDCGWLN